MKGVSRPSRPVSRALTPERQTFLGSAAVVLGCSLLALIGSYIVRVLYARTFTPADYGLLYAVITWLAILGMIRNLGMGEALTFFVSRRVKDTAYGRRALRITLGVQITLGIVIVIAAALLGDIASKTLIRDPRVPQLFLIFAVAYAVVGITEAIVAYYRGRQQMLYVGLSEPLRNVVVAIVSIVVLMSQKSLYAISFAWLFTYAFTALVYILLLLRTAHNDRISESGRGPKSQSITFTEMLQYAFPSFLAAAGLFVFYNVDTVIITALLGTYYTGLYNAAIPLANLLLIVTVPITIVVFPAISSLAGAGKRDSLLRIHALAARIGLVASLCCAAPFLLFGPQLLGYFFGNEYSVAAIALQVLLIGGVLRSLVEIEFAVLAGLGAVKARAWLLAAALVCNVLLNFWLVPLHGITGAAIATTVSFGLLLIATILYARRVHQVCLPLHLLPKALGAVLPVFFLGIFFAPRMPSFPFVALLGVMAAASLLTFAWAWICGLVTNDDIATGFGFVTSLFGRAKG